MALIQQAKAWEYLLLFGAPQHQSAILSPVPLFGTCPLADFQFRMSPVDLDPLHLQVPLDNLPEAVAQAPRWGSSVCCLLKKFKSGFESLYVYLFSCFRCCSWAVWEGTIERGEISLSARNSLEQALKEKGKSGPRARWVWTEMSVFRCYS